MREITVDLLIVGHEPSWGKWPDTEDRDFSALTERVETWTTIHLSTRYTVRQRTYPVFSAFLGLPEERDISRWYPVIDNRIPLPAEVVQRHVRALLQASNSSKILWWMHAYLCRPETMRVVEPAFPFKVIQFGDDAPGSSEIKTFPVAAHFDALFHTMLIRDFRKGVRTAEEYRARGCPEAYFVPSGRSEGLDRWCTDTSFDFDAKMAALAKGDRLPQDVVWFGGLSGCHWRQSLLRRIDAWPRTDGPLHFEIRGAGLRDGLRRPWHPAEGDGYVTAPAYADAWLGFNLQHSSIFNTRLRDLWRMGVAQFIFDPHEELSTIGAVPGTHFVPFDGTEGGLRAAMLDWSTGPRDRLVDLLWAGRNHEHWLAKEWAPNAVIGRMLYEHEAAVAAPP